MENLIDMKASNIPLLSWPDILDASHNGIVIIDRSGVILVYNKAARRLLEEGDHSPVGRHFSEIRPETWPDLKNILETGLPQIGKKIVLPQATIIANRNPIIVDGKVVGAISVFQDISEHEALISDLQGYRKLHRELEAIFESSFDGLYITDGRANTIRVNSAYERITGLKREDLIGRNMVDLVREGVFDHSATIDVLEQRSQVTIIQKIMGDKHLLVTGTPIFDDENGIALVVTNVRDITLLNELKAQLDESRRLSSRYYQSLVEKEKFQHDLQDMVVKSGAMIQTVQRAIKVAAADASVLLSGESGAGKSMLARIIHLISPRKERPFIKINCGAIPDSLIESELFGYARGAFTGAAPEGKAGLIEVGHTGTVLLDEVGELTLAMQVKLLQVIEEKVFTRLGGLVVHEDNVRIIAATNKNLKDLVQQGRFREDLYYRLDVVPIHIPPLRERRDDIAALALNRIEKFNRTSGSAKRLDQVVMDRLMRYNYPGNVRELINIMERMMIMSDGNLITIADLPAELRERPQSNIDSFEDGTTLTDAMKQFECRIIGRALNCHKSLSMAARALGVHPTTLWRKMTKFGISKPNAMSQ
ncbi:MAG: sigma 54-interacting transcriptional regulator [Deltaproteobacteria bacterium]|nr:sigma 54-interacting transcriptional regulator [Deltaproteobacteria bacterium]